MDGVHVSHPNKRKMKCQPLPAFLFAFTVLAGMAARGNTLPNGFAGTNQAERVETVAGITAPAWGVETGNYVEITGTFAQSAQGEVSAFIRLLDEKSPLILSWHGSAGFQLAAPGRLPQNIPDTASPPAGPQTVAWRLRIRSLQHPEQRLVLETRNPNGSWQKIMEKSMALDGIQEWIGEGGVLTVGLSGAVELVDGETRVRVLREGTLLMVK